MKNEKEFLTGMVHHLMTDHIPEYKKECGKHGLKGACWWLLGCFGLVKGVCHFMDSMEWAGKTDTIHCEIDMLNRRLTEVERNENQ